MLPSLFVSHGDPRGAVMDTATSQYWAQWAASHPTPTGIVVISAHWIAHQPTVTTWDTRPLTYDFYGFPDALYQVQYPAPGSPALARQVQSLLQGDGTGATEREPWAVAHETKRGLDHGAFVPLMRLYPQASIPVVALSLVGGWGPAQHVEIGRRLAPLRAEGVLILASGSATHNLGALSDMAFQRAAWADGFMADLEAKVTSADWVGLLNLPQRSPYYRMAHPTDEHFWPIYVALGAGCAVGGAGEADPLTPSAPSAEKALFGTQARFSTQEWVMGNLAMSTVEFEAAT